MLIASGVIQRGKMLNRELLYLGGDERLFVVVQLELACIDGLKHGEVTKATEIA